MTLFLFAVNLYARQTSLSEKQLNEDFAIFEGSIKEAHAGLYWYNDTVSIDGKLSEIKSSIKQDMSQTEFHKLLQEFYAGINCGHSWMSKPSDFINKRESGNYYFPFNLFFNEYEARVSKDYTSEQSLNIGAEVIEIDGQTIPSIFKTLYKFIPSDGFNVTGKNRIIAGQFAEYYQEYIKMNDQVTLLIKEEGSDQTKLITINCLSKSTFEEQSKRTKTSTEDLLSFKIVDNQTGLLKIKTFSKGWIKYQQKVSFKEFIKEVLTEIREKNNTKLILDLRYNGGGDDEFGSLLNTYLIPKKFRYFEKMELSSKKFSYLKYSDTKGLKLASLLIKKSKEKPNTYLWTHHPPLKEQKPTDLIS